MDEGRFEIRRELGSGAGARVLEVYDRLNGEVRALKRSKDDSRVERFRHEFRLLTELRHPGVVRAYDYAENNGCPEFTMELVRGASLHARGAVRDFEWIEAVAQQLLGALQTIHARGWVHGDIASRNVLVAGTEGAPIVRLVDFGASHRIGDASQGKGTLPYAAPELLADEAVDGRSDLYALGVVLYELLLPERVGTSMESVAAWHRECPAAPHDVDPVIPTGLSRLVEQLLQPSPDDRFDNSTQAVEFLQHERIGIGGRATARARAERLLRGGAISHRRTELGWVTHYAKQVSQRGEGWTLWLRGGKGMGKTPFLRELDANLCLEGFRVLRCKVDGPSGEAVGPLLDAARALAPEDVKLPALGARPATVEPAAFAADIARTIVTALGAEPTALIIDDVHLAEPIARQVLSHLSNDIRAVPMLLVCSGEAPLDALDASGEVGELELRPLEAEQVAALVAHRLLDLRLPASALERLTKDSQGMPSLVERTLARLLAAGTIRAGGKGFYFTGGRYVAASHDDSERLEARLARVEESDEPVVAAAAVLRTDISAESVAAVAGRSVPEAAEALARLSESHVLMPGAAADTPGFIFTSKPLRLAAYERLSAIQRQELHDQAATFLEETPGTAPNVLAEHRLRGSDTELAVAAALAEGDRAASIFADKRASTYYSRGFAKLRNTRDGRRRVLAARLGQVALRGGRLDSAQDWYETALRCSEESEKGDAEGKAEALLALGRIALSRGESKRAKNLADDVRRALADVPASPRFLRWLADADRVEAAVAQAQGKPDEAETLLLAALQILSGVEPGREEVDILISLATLAQSRADPAASVRLARRALQRARAIDDLSAVAESYRVLGRGFLRALRIGATRKSFAKGLEAARTARDRLQEAGLLREIGNLHLRQADFTAALGFYDRSLQLVRTSRARADESACLHNIGLVNALLGNFRAALSAYEAALEVAEDIGDVPGRAATALEIGHAHGCLGEPERGLEWLAQADELALAAEEHAIWAEARAYSAWLTASVAPHETATAMERIKEATDGLDDVAGRAECFIYAARAHLVSGDYAAALPWARIAAEEVSKGDIASMEVEALIVLGAALSHQSSMEEALAPLDEAARRAVEYGLKPLEVEARLWLARVLPSSRERDDHLTTAMELTRTIASELSDELLATYLERPDALTLREAFRGVHGRVVAGT